MDLPQISVLLPVHNGMPYLPPTIESVLAQSFQDFEILAMDDGSTDESSSYLRQLSDSRLKYFRLEKAGLVGALNYGLTQARAPLVARIDADDLAMPSRLALQFDHFRGHPDCVLLGCDFDEIDGSGNVTGENEFKMTSDAALRWQMLFAMPFLHPGIMFRTKTAREIGGYRAIYDVAEDYDICVRLAGRGSISSLSERLMHKRIHSAAVSIVHHERGMTQSSEIAAEYARTVSTDLDINSIRELFWFFNRRIPKGMNVARAAGTLSQTCNIFSAEQNSNPDFQDAVRAARRKLRWLCIDQMKRELHSPGRAFMWFRASGLFDPENGTILKVARRKLHKMVSAGSNG